MEYYSAVKRNTFGSALMRYMNLESVIQGEVSQKEKNKYCILTHIYGNQKDGTYEPIFKAAVETQMQRTDLWTWAGGGGGDNGESSMEIHTYTTMCKIDSRWEFPV